MNTLREFQSQFLSGYTYTGGGIVTTNARENQNHVSRLVRYAELFGDRIGLTPDAISTLKTGMIYSDIGKNQDWNRDRLSYFFRPRAKKGLDGLALWLQWYQKSTGTPLTLIKDTAPFTITNDAKANRRQAARFYQAIFASQPPYYPLGLYFHEIPGFVAAHAAGLGQDVLEVIFAHNGPEISLGPDGLPQYCFWGEKKFKPITGTYPLPFAHNKLALLHTMLDRFDQGALILFPGDQEPQGGVIKIARDRVAQGATQSFEEILSAMKKDLPPEAMGQIHYLWREAIEGADFEEALRPVHDALIAGLSHVATHGEAIKVSEWPQR